MITADTQLLTKQGLKTAKDLLFQLPVELLCPTTGAWQEGYLQQDYRAPVWTYRLAPYYNTNTGEPRTWEFKAPRPCCFPLVGGGVTWDLRKKDVLCANCHDSGYDAQGWASGFMYRFNILSLSNLDPAKYPPYTDKLQTLKTSGQIAPPSGLPCDGETVLTKGSFLRGYLAADKHKCPLATNDEAFFEFFIENHAYAGLVLTGSPRKWRKTMRINNKATFYDEHIIAYSKGSEFAGFRVVDIVGPSESVVPVYSVGLSQPGDYVINGGWTTRSD